MAYFPQTGTWTQGNRSDRSGDISVSKNINLDEETYLKLSSKVVSIMSEETDSDFDVPLSLGRGSQGTFYLVTAEDPFVTSMSTITLNVSQDTDADGDPVPVFTNRNFGRWWQSRWYVSTDNGTNGLKYKTISNGNWTNVSISATTTVAHPIEVFRNRRTLCFGNGNVVKQINTSHSATVDLTLPSDYEVIGLAYSNNKMGILTRLGTSTTGTNDEAYFFEWRGDTTEAGTGIPIGSDAGVALLAYKGSWIVVTRTGQILMYSGGGFTEVGAFPFYFKDRIWGDFLNRVAFGDCVKIEGDVVYFNFGWDLNTFGANEEQYLPYCPSGVWCFDPKVGVYHRYSASTSPAVLKQVAQADVNTTDNILTTSATVPETGSIAKYVNNTADDSSIGGLTLNSLYYVIKLSATTFQLATTAANATAGTAIDLTSQGGANHFFLIVTNTDYGVPYSGKTGGVELMGFNNEIYNHIIFGSDLTDYDSTTEYAHLCMSVPDFPNRAYAILSRIDHEGRKGTAQNVVVKYKPLDTNDSIIVKVKTKEVIGLPVTTPQNGETNSETVTWLTARSFTTAHDISAAKTYLDASEANKCEVEIISGAGAGNSIQIDSIQTSGSGYIVNLAEDVDGASVGRGCEIQIDNWRKIGEITSSDTEGVKSMGVGETSTWYKLKIELRGVNTTIESVETKEVEFAKI